MTSVSIAIIVLLIVLFIGQVGFVFRYGTRSPWRATWQGMTLMAQTSTIALLALFFIFDTMLIGDWPVRIVLLLTLLTLLAIESWIALSGLLHVQQTKPPVSERQGTGYVPDEHIEHHEGEEE